MPNPSASKPAFYGIWAQAVSRYNRAKTMQRSGETAVASACELKLHFQTPFRPLADTLAKRGAGTVWE